MARDAHRRIEVLRLDLAVERGALGSMNFGETTRPVTRASSMMSTRPVAIIMPSISPRTVMTRATISPLTTASAPTVTA